MSGDSLGRFDELARRACGESPPAIDVSGRVLDTLRSRRTESLRPPVDVLLFGAGSLLAACAALAFLWVGLADDSFLTFLAPFLTGFQ